MIGEQLGHYRIERRLGAGGMGMVYVARDTRLGRPVAIKVIHEGLDDADMRERMWREARAAAALNHPAICQVYDVGESGGRLFVVMELLEGETLADRIAYGTLEGAEVVRIGLALLDGLAALHRLDIVHRDLKPSNVFLLSDRRVKLLDFGLVRVAPSAAPATPGGAPASSGSLTRPGLGIGSPGYMPPEQALGGEVDARSDLYSLGVVLYEAASGRRAFEGANAIELMHAAMHRDPPSLRGSAWLEQLGTVLKRAMTRQAAGRFASAHDMASALRDLAAGTAPAAAPAFTRLAVLPFRMLRPDPDRDFLAPSLADAIAMSLAGIRSLVVRSTVASARHATETIDLEKLTSALDVDVVLVGTLLAAGERCRVAVQLVEAPAGNVRWSETLDVSSRDIFELQDLITRRIVESLHLPLTAGEQGALSRNVPANAAAYELFLRANQLCSPEGQPAVARDLYMQALETDPTFAPAWVRLGTCHRLLGKYFVGDTALNYRRAQEAVSRAFELRPDFPAAALARAQIELDLGHTESAIEYLLGVVERNPNDPAGFAGLVTALRYAGFLDAARAAHRRALELDPEVRTSHLYTAIASGDFDSARAATEPYPRAIGLLESGDFAASSTAVNWDHRSGGSVLRAHLEGRRDEVPGFVAAAGDFPDPEGRCVSAMFVAAIGELDAAFGMLERAVRGGFFCAPALSLTVFASLQSLPAMDALRREAEERHQRAAAQFGDRIAALGLAG
jgi:non-specific serine/threonine protein kinase